MLQRRLACRPNVYYIRHIRCKSRNAGDINNPNNIAGMPRSNGKATKTRSTKPTSNYFKRNSEYNNKIPQLTVRSSTASNLSEHGLSDLSSVASMNTILGILEEAQRSVLRKETSSLDDTSVDQQAPAAFVKQGEAGTHLGAGYLDDFFNLKPLLTLSPRDRSEAEATPAIHGVTAPSLSRLLYKTENSSILGKSVYEYIVVRYLNDQGISERGHEGGFEGLGMYQDYISTFLEAFESSFDGSKYRNDNTLTLNKSLNVFQAIAMHFIKRPDAAVELLLKDVESMVNGDLKLKSMLNITNEQDETVIASDANKVNYKLPRQFKIEHQPSPSKRSYWVSKDSQESLHPVDLSPIYNQYDLAKLKHRDYLVQLPFILNDYEVISRVLVKNTERDTITLQRILASQSIEGAKLYEIVVKLRLIKVSSRLDEEFLALTDSLLKSAVSCKSDLTSKVNRFSTKISKSFLEREFDESKCISLLEQQFNVYFAVWYRLSAQDAMKWCFSLVDHYRELPLTINELEQLREEALDYFKFQTRSEKAHKFILEEKNLSTLARHLVI